jgi:tetratricopeptide (TPR) repeat protein
MAGYAHTLLEISPHAVVARACLIRTDGDYADTIGVAQEVGCQHPRLLFDLGQYYQKKKQFEATERCWKAALAASPDRLLFKSLADNYKAQGKMDLWLETLQAFLKEEDPGLGHAQVQVEIATEFMKRAEYHKALPYAEEAAETYAVWAMQCASLCHEALGNFDKAELWARRVSERYATSYTDWYFFCRRTSKGDVQAAERLAVAAIEQIGTKATGNDLLHIGAFYWFSGQYEKAADAYRAFGKAKPSDALSMHLVTIYDRAGNHQERDRHLKQVVGPYKELAALFQACLAKGEKAELDVPAVDRQVAKWAANMQIEAAYYIGCFLDRRGYTTTAVDYFSKCVLSMSWTSPAYIDSAMYLRNHGIEPRNITNKK